MRVQGSVELPGEPGGLLAAATAIARRYVGADQAEEFGRRNGVPGELVVRMWSAKILAHFNMPG